MRRALLPALAILLLAACRHDMRWQEKENAYATAATAPQRIPADTVQFGERGAIGTAPPLTLALIERGQQRFRIFCTPCHSELGDGRGMAVRRGFSAPPNYLLPRLRNASPQLFYNVITNGFGAMYSFARRVPSDDRWAIAAYIRALQISQDSKYAELSEADKAALKAADAAAGK
jgi:mono/diheme cytochrome c family protein